MRNGRVTVNDKLTEMSKAYFSGLLCDNVLEIFLTRSRNYDQYARITSYNTTAHKFPISNATR